jgi:GR25 family glycosyltransferase involved in LPS biosynthesis
MHLMLEHDHTYPKRTIDSYFDRVFYINLDRDLDRNLRMVEQFSKFGIRNFERIRGHEVLALPNNLKFRNFIKRDMKYVLGGLGCTASHLECVRLAKERGYSKIMILEDDAVFLEDPNVLLTRNQEILMDWDLLYFGGLIEPFFRNQVVCLHAYAIRSTLFDDVLEMAEHSGMEIDNFYAKVIQHMSYNHNQSGKYNVRTVLPFNQIVQDKSIGSNIQR